MSSVSLEFNLSEIEKRFETLQARLANLTPLMAEIGSMLETSSTLRFETKTAPDGAKWPALAASTVKARSKANRTPNDILIFRGALSGSITSRASPDQAIVSMGGSGDSTAYARAHQFGALISRAGVKVGGYTIRLPARPVLGISQDDAVEIGHIADDFLEKIFR